MEIYDGISLAVAIFYSFCFLVGLVLNSLLAKTAFTSKDLHGFCHVLIGIRAVCDILHQAGHLPLLYSLVSDEAVTQRNCYYLQIIPILSIVVGCTSLLLLCLDRVRAILWPLSYRLQRGQAACRTYTTLFLCFIVAAGILVMVQDDSDSDKPVICSIPSGLGPRPRLIFVFLLFLTSDLMATLYFVCAAVLRTHTCSNKRRRCIFRSILCCALVALIGLVLTATVHLTLIVYAEYDVRQRNPAASREPGHFLFLSAATLELLVQRTPRCRVIEICSGIILNALCSANYFIYFKMSCDYRRALKNQWQRIGLAMQNSESETTEVQRSML